VFKPQESNCFRFFPLAIHLVLLNVPSTWSLHRS